MHFRMRNGNLYHKAIVQEALIMHGAFLFILYLAAVLLVCLAAALISIRIITRLLKEPWGRVLVGVAFAGLLAACASLALRSYRADKTARNFNDACRYAMDLALMYRLDSERKSASQSQRPELEMKFLATCSLVQHDERLFRHGPIKMYEWPRLPGSGYRLDEELRAAVLHADRIAFDLMEHSSSNKVRRRASELVVYSSANTDPRVFKALSSYMRDQHAGALDGGLGERGDRLTDLGVAGIYYARGEYKNALDLARSALGEDWARTGRVDKWWQLYLPLTTDDHMRFGYLFHKGGQNDRALREFRLAKGVDRTPDEMREAYVKPPVLSSTH